MATEGIGIAGKFGAGVGTVAAFSSSTAKTSAALDTTGFTTATAFWSMGDVAGGGSHTLTISVEECATIGGSYAAITGATTGAIDVSDATVWNYGTIAIQVNLQNSNRLKFLKLVATPSAHAVDVGLAGGGIVLQNGGQSVATSTTSAARLTRVVVVA